MHQINKLDARIILPHLLASFCLVFAFTSLSYLIFIDIIQTYAREGVDGLIYLAHEKDTDIINFMSHFIMYSTIIPYVGLLISIVISFFVVFFRKSPKLNVLIVLLVSLGVNLLWLEHGLSKASIKPGEFIFGEGQASLIFNMVAYALLGIILFSLNWKRFFNPPRLGSNT